MADPEEFLAWLESKGVGVAPERDPTQAPEHLGFIPGGPEAEIERVEFAYGSLPDGVRRWFQVDAPGRLRPNQVFGWLDAPWYAASLPEHLGPIFLADEDWNGSYRPLVELGSAPSHLLLLSLTTTVYLGVECVGPRAGWVYSVSAVPTTRPPQKWARPVARSLGEFLDGVMAVTEAGLWVGGDSYGLMPPEPRVWPPEGMPLAYVSWTSQDFDLAWMPENQTEVREPPSGVRVLGGSVAELLGFEPPDRHSEPAGLTVVHDGSGLHPEEEEI